MQAYLNFDKILAETKFQLREGKQSLEGKLGFGGIVASTLLIANYAPGSMSYLNKK